MFDPKATPAQEALTILLADIGNRLVELAHAPEALSPNWRTLRAQADALKQIYRLAWSNRASVTLLGLLQDRLKAENPTALAFDWLPCGHVAQEQQVKAVALVPLGAEAGIKGENFSIRLSPGALAVVEAIMRAESKPGKPITRNAAIEIALMAYLGPRCPDCGTPLVPLDAQGKGGFYECPQCALGDEVRITPGGSLDYVLAKIESKK